MINKIRDILAVIGLTCMVMVFGFGIGMLIGWLMNVAK
jgi:hypothetical protein